MTEVAIRTEPRMTLDQKMTYARVMAEASLLPAAYRRQPGNVLLAIEVGESLRLPTVVAINNIHVIDGKPSSSAALVSALVRRAGHRLRISGDDERAVAEIVRSDDPEFTYRSEWTVARAKTAGLLGKGGSWTNYRAAMLKARAVTEVARDACQEVLSGLVQYTPEELGAVVDGDGEPIAQEIMPAPPASPAPVTHHPPASDKPNRSVELIAAEARTGDLDTVRGLWREASAGRQMEIDVADHDTGEVLALGHYLERRLVALAQVAPAATDPGVIDGAVVDADTTVPDADAGDSTDTGQAGDADPWSTPAADGSSDG